MFYAAGPSGGVDDPVFINGLTDVITSDMLSGVFSEILALLPVVIPVMVSFLALRKGIAFVRSILQSA